MGVPKFFRYISERYPCLSDLVKEFQIPDFDNLYLDMNGIIHTCSHPDDSDPYFSITEENIFASIFHYIEVLFNIIKPKKLFFMAVDGVAPRAKMNQQRARRFRTAKESELKYKEALKANNDKPLPKERFDSNCITPGTVFMDRLHTQLKYFVTSKISSDPMWQRCKIILSGHQTPGEGEHKIMDYIRYLKTLPDYDHNTNHCLYGLDADLIMLGLCTHEPHFALLREKVRFSKQESKRVTSPDETEFYLLHLSLLREYLDLEFQELKDTLPFQYNLENIIDDWILMSFLVGNDFIPNLPDLHLTKGAFPILYKAYKEVLPTMDGYLNENGYLNLARFEQFMEKMSKFDLEVFEDLYANLSFLEEKRGNAFQEKSSNGLPARKTELEELIKATEEFELSDEEFFEENNDIEDDTFLWEFSQHKKHYYTSKLDYRQVTPEVLRSQAEGYVRAIQWNLHYYYHGCQSWSWYYPHHYSPYISDIRDFKDLKLDFEMGKPFQPFEQLLAVLPAASKNLLPEPFRDLMTSPNSPIKDFYPEDFQTDLNGKKQDWEAVVLIPLIDEKRLLEAMKEANEKLSPEEIRRNQHGPMHVFTYTEEDLGLYKSDCYFPSIPANHALMKDVSREEIMVDPSQLNYGLGQGVVLGTSYPKFPTFKHIPFTSDLKMAKVRVFEHPSKGQSIVLTLKEREFPALENLAKDLLGKIVHFNWPHLKESRAVGVSDGKVRYSITENGCQQNEVLERPGHLEWVNESHLLGLTYQQKLGVEVGPVEVLVYGQALEGWKYVFDSSGKLVVEKMWSSTPIACPLQVVVTSLPAQDRNPDSYTQSKAGFPLNAVVFMLGQPHFGSKGRVLDSTELSKNGRVKVALETVNELFIHESFLKTQPKAVYLPCRVAALKVGVSPRMLSRIMGSILVSTTEDTGDCAYSRINIGLNLKFYKKNEEVPGYTKRENDNWLYSPLAVDVACKYVEKFSRVVDYLSNETTTNVFLAKDIFPGPEGLNEMKEMVAWLKEQEYQKVEKLKTGTELLSPEVVSKVEKIVDGWTMKVSIRQMQVKPHLLYKSDLVYGSMAPVKSAKHRLLDRVISIRSSYTVPTGLRGFIIGIHPGSQDADVMYDVLFDQAFVGARKLNSTSEKVFRMSRASFLNISDANRQLSRPHNALVDSIAKTVKQIFTQPPQQPPPPTKNGCDDSFKQIWSSLQKTQPQEDALKKILKIEKKEQNVEDPVKSFFEKITKVPEQPPQLPPGNAPPRNRYYRQLLAVFKQRHWGQPNFKFVYVNGKVTARLTLNDGRTFPGLPCDEKESACESAALQALNALGEIPSRTEPLIQAPEVKRPPPPSWFPQMPLPGPPAMDYMRLYQPKPAIPPVLPNPPSQWVLATAPIPQEIRTVAAPSVVYNNPLQRENFYLRPRFEPPERPLIPPHFVNPKLNASALEFVPLQAIVGKRPTRRMNVPHNPPQSVEPQKKTEVSANFYKLPGAPPSTSKPRRSSKIAAKLDFDPNLY